MRLDHSRVAFERAIETADGGLVFAGFAIQQAQFEVNLGAGRNDRRRAEEVARRASSKRSRARAAPKRSSTLPLTRFSKLNTSCPDSTSKQAVPSRITMCPSRFSSFSECTGRDGPIILRTRSKQRWIGSRWRRVGNSSLASRIRIRSLKAKRKLRPRSVDGLMNWRLTQ